MKQSTVTIALAGNPNSGKSVLFNALTGSRQRVGNWPGVTVERKEGKLRYLDQQFSVVDLPGVYSLSILSEEGSLDERLACDYLLSGQADLVVNIIDASNLERNLYLTLQLLEMQVPVVLAVNMLDIARKRGLQLDLQKLGEMLQCPVVGVIASQGKGIKELKRAISQMAATRCNAHFQLPLPVDIQAAVAELQDKVTQSHPEVRPYWFSLRLLEDDHYASQQVSPSLQPEVKALQAGILSEHGEEADILIADARYNFSHQLSDSITNKKKSVQQTVTEHLDKVILNRFLGIPIFLFIMYLMFAFAINIGVALQDFFDIGSTAIFVTGTAKLLMSWHAPPWLIAILANGLGKGINTTVTFIPVLGMMFLFLSFLEDSGYMARAAFVMDRLMRMIGLPGRSFVPMIVGFGCNVPAVMGARTLGSQRERILTVMMMPFMSCGARLAIFAVFASAFFPVGGQDIIFLLYVTGILVAIGSGLILRNSMLPGKAAPLVMELPPYHMPRLRTLLRHAWLRLKSFLTRASKVIVPVCVILGALNAVSVHGKLMTNPNQKSVLAAAGEVVTPVFRPMGLQQDNWPATVGLVTGVLAKEVVIGTLNTLYSEAGHVVQHAEHTSVTQQLMAAVKSVPANLALLGNAFKNPFAANEAPTDMDRAAMGVMYHRFVGKAGAFAYLLFVLLYFPCISTLAVMRREVGKRWAAFSMVWSTGMAYVLAVLVYQSLTITLHPVSSSVWLTAMLTVIIVAVIALRRYSESAGRFLARNS